MGVKFNEIKTLEHSSTAVMRTGSLEGMCKEITAKDGNCKIFLFEWHRPLYKNLIILEYCASSTAKY